MYFLYALPFHNLAGKDKCLKLVLGFWYENDFVSCKGGYSLINFFKQF